ncbi:MAG: WG repeat-containing protein [Clostridiales bacterium]|nr:WG repeat-containing protein [Clostridiales bacterium]
MSEIRNKLNKKYDGVAEVSDGMFRVFDKQQWGFTNDKGEEIVKPQYSDSRAFHEGFAGVMKDGKWAFIDKSGKVICDFIYDKVRDFSGGLAEVSKWTDGKALWGYIDTTGKEVIECKYDSTSPFGNSDITVVGINNGLIRIDRKGNEANLSGFYGMFGTDL